MDACSGPVAPTDQHVLTLEQVAFNAGGTALLSDISLSVTQGSCLALLGPNGAGKSLLLRVAQGLLAPARGRVALPAPAGSGKAATAIVFQRPVMLRRSAAGNIRHGLAAVGVPRPERAPRARLALARMGLSEAAQRPARRLSGGEQQRLAMARAWAMAPRVLLLDEPTASLDPAGAKAIEAAIRAVHDEGTTIIIATHDLGQARRLAGRVAFLHRGRLMEDSPAQRFFQQGPATAAAAAFVQGDLLA